MRALFTVFFIYFAAFAQESVEQIEEQIKQINERMLASNAWIKRYQDQRDYQTLQSENVQLQIEIKKLANRQDKTARAQVAQLEERRQILQARIDLLSETGSLSLESLSRVEAIGEPPAIKQPLAIIAAFGYMRDSTRALKEQRSRLDDLRETIKIEQELQRLTERQMELLKADKNDTNAAKKALMETTQLLTALGNIEEVFSTALSVQDNRFINYKIQLEEQIESEIVNLITILIIIAVILALSFASKGVASRAVKDASRMFGIRRGVNIITFCVIVLILLFNYINNITYFITLLGFISAGIAIAMKDWFMSLLGWGAIVFGGSIHIGDRVRVVLDGEQVVGDVLEIGLTRIMLFEDITLTTFTHNRRAGRIIHIPNNYIFTHIIQNYTYNEMQTVWDGIDIVISFDSNHKKALKIAKEIAAKHAAGYTDLARKHYGNLRARFNMRTVNVEPRVFTFAHIYGMKVSIWYLTNSYSTLALRSAISQEVIEAFNNAEHIKIAYPTYVAGLEPLKAAPAADAGNLLDAQGG
ncbi:MAG: mechanosensitive ion channel [Helicobacteraceae bacterium]|jgi:small-conductance mechanosensitive channel|nr:mechanosensitive ion channel [Helicobacteraceae bacterium]